MRAITNGLGVSLCWSTSDRLHPLLAHSGGGYLCLRMARYTMDGVKRRATAASTARLLSRSVGSELLQPRPSTFVSGASDCRKASRSEVLSSIQECNGTNSDKKNRRC